MTSLWYGWTPESGRGRLRIRLQWTKLSQTYLSERCETVLIGNSVYFFGFMPESFDSLVFSMKTFTWEAFETPIKRRYHHACTLADGNIYILGGQAGVMEYHDNVMIFDPVLKEALLLNDMNVSPASPDARAGMSAVWAPWRREIICFLEVYIDEFVTRTLSRSTWITPPGKSSR